MALNRITGLGMVVLGSSMLLAVACDSGGTTTSPSNAGGSANSGAGGNAATGGTSSPSNTISGSTGGKATTTTTAAATGGTSTSTSSTGPTCPASITQPTATGQLQISNGYVTAGSYAGYGFTWTGKNSIGDTCVTPKCGTASCSPSFGTSALCGAGVVAADTTYGSVIGIGFNLKQTSAGGTPGSVAAGSTVTVGATLGTGTGDQNARVQIVDAAGNNYCVASGAWTSGTAIDITQFNTSCWDTTLAGATALSAGTDIVSVDIIVPSDSTTERPFSICFTNFVM